MRSSVAQALALGALVLLASKGEAQTAPAATENETEVLKIWPGEVPETPWTGEEMKLGTGTPVYTNVTVPTLTVFRPKKGTTTGASMIVLPGGAFRALVFGMEGTEVAKWLAERGVTAFVLKYRVHMSTSGPGPNPGDQGEGARQERPRNPAREIALADGRQAVHYLRTNAARLGISPDRIGMMGFSAGAMTTMATILDSDVADRPNLAASIYGSMDDKVPPADAPPVFVAAAADDATVDPAGSVKIYSAWRSAKLTAELHLYEKGGHGFGMLKHQTTSDHWTDDFENWLTAHGWISAQQGH
jgi:acetyl esterase/lipase